MKKYTILYNILLVGFLLGIHEGKVALWRDNREEPIKVLPFQATMLPEVDQKRLERGIHVDSLGELYQLLEDYFS